VKSQDQSELDQLKARLDAVGVELQELRARTRTLETRLRVTQGVNQVATAYVVPAEAMATAAQPVVVEAKQQPARAQPPPLPPLLVREAARAIPQMTTAGAPSRVAGVGERSAGEAPTTSLPRTTGGAGSSTGDGAGTADRPSFEMRLGTYWLVRVGVVMVLTAMVFFGRYAYEHFVSPLGPPGKLLMMYLASGGLLWAGHWLQRRQESLRQYGQVLFSGGLAAVYFTTYAAHHVPNLRVIESAVLDGLLLLGWAGYMVWLADRRKSEVLSMFGVGLGFYTSVMTQAGLFTLYSNLVLTLAAVFFLLRNRWTTLSFGALVATYAGYAFWRFYHGGAWHWAGPEDGLWTGTYFLACYWVVFSAAVFLSRDRMLAGSNRATFLTLNNGAFFALFLLTMLQVQSGGFWKFALVYGVVLTGLAELARRVLPSEPVTRNSYVVQGLVLVTVGLIARFSGPNLGLILAAESVVLVVLGGHRRSVLLEAFGFVAAALATYWTVTESRAFDRGDLWLGIGVGALLVFNSIWRARREDVTMTSTVRPGPALLGTLGLLVWLVATWNNVTRLNLPVVLAIEAAFLTATIHWVRVREIALLGQGYLILAHSLWLFATVAGNAGRPWWNAVSVLAITLALSHWWQRQRVIDLDVQVSRLLQGLYSLALVGVLHVWLQPQFTPSTWLVFSGGVALVITAYGTATRGWLLVAAGQLFVAVTVWQFASQLMAGHPGWHVALAPLVTLTVLSMAAVQWISRRPETSGEIKTPVLGVAMAYRWVALLMGVAWVHEYVPARERFWTLALVGALIFAWAGWRRSVEGFVAAAVLAAMGYLWFWFPSESVAVTHFPNVLAVWLMLAAQQAARRWPDRFPLGGGWHNAMIVLGGLSFWRLASSWVSTLAGGFYLTVAWTGVAFVLFLAGLALRERMYRWLGLGILGCGLARVVLLDVWKLETLARTFSFFALGVVLLVLGFIYNRYQDRIRHWL
jgi:uncharacterized membrane protein